MMADRDFWLLVRRALLMIVHAIEKKYAIPPSKRCGLDAEHIVQ